MILTDHYYFKKIQSKFPNKKIKEKNSKQNFQSGQKAHFKKFHILISAINANYF